MAGIKETKDQLRNEILELYKRFTAAKPEVIFSVADNKGQLLLHAELASALAKKIEALGYLSSVEEEIPAMVIVPPITQTQAPGITFSEIIPSVEKTIPPPAPLPEMKNPEVVPQLEKNIPLTPFAEMKNPEVVPQLEKNIPPTPFPEMKNPDVAPQLENNFPPAPVPGIKKPEIVQTPKPAGKVLPDLKSFIGFNEKLMFVRSLFKGNTTDYENALAEVNICATYKEADIVIQKLSAANKWSPEDEPVQIFYSIVKRRFA